MRNHPCRDIIHYVRTFRKKRITLTFIYLYAPQWRADIMNYVPTKGIMVFWYIFFLHVLRMYLIVSVLHAAL